MVSVHFGNSQPLAGPIHHNTKPAKVSFGQETYNITKEDLEQYKEMMNDQESHPILKKLAKAAFIIGSGVFAAGLFKVSIPTAKNTVTDLYNKIKPKNSDKAAKFILDSLRKLKKPFLAASKFMSEKLTAFKNGLNPEKPVQKTIKSVLDSIENFHTEKVAPFVKKHISPKVKAVVDEINKPFTPDHVEDTKKVVAKATEGTATGVVGVAGAVEAAESLQENEEQA